MEGEGLRWEKRSPASLQLLEPYVRTPTTAIRQTWAPAQEPYKSLRTHLGTPPSSPPPHPPMNPFLFIPQGKSQEVLLFFFPDLVIVPRIVMWRSVHLNPLPSVSLLWALSWPCVDRGVLPVSCPDQGLLRKELCHPEMVAFKKGLFPAACRWGLLGRP